MTVQRVVEVTGSVRGVAVTSQRVVEVTGSVRE